MKKSSNFGNLKRIAFLNPSMTMGGTEKVLINLLKSLDYTKVSVDLFLLSQSGELLGQVPNEVNLFELSDNIVTSFKQIAEQYIMKFRLFSLLRLCFVRIFLAIFRTLNIKKFEKKFYKLLMKEWGKNYLLCNENIPKHYDVVIAFQCYAEILLFYAGCVFNADRRIMWAHGCSHITNNYYKYTMDAFDSFDKIICVSKGVNEWFCKKYPDTLEKTEVIYNLLDVNDIMIRSNEPVYDMKNVEGKTVIVSVGRLSKEKGFQLIPQIAKTLNDDKINFDWFIVGDGDLRSQINNEIFIFKTFNVHLLGAKINPYPYMRNCTLYVQPSFTEGYCTTTNEAKVLCKSILVTDVPGMREQFVHGFNGYIVSNATVQDIADGIKYLLSNKKEMIKYEQNLQDYYLHCNDSMNDFLKLLS